MTILKPANVNIETKQSVSIEYNNSNNKYYYFIFSNETTIMSEGF